jgi:hypothetical protein
MDNLKTIAPLLSTTASFLFLLLGAVAIASMMLRMGRNGDAGTQRYVRVHHAAGWSFVALFVGMFVYMLTRVVHYNDEFSSRITMHFTLAIALVCLLAIKVSIPRFFPNFSKHLFLLGSGAYLLAFPMVMITGGYHVEKMITREPYVYHDDFVKKFADDNLGKTFLISKCSSCHVLHDILKPRSEQSWTVTIDRMVDLAQPRISKDEAGQILSFLSKHYAPRKRVAAANASLIEKHCLPCHEEADILAGSHSAEAWRTIVRKMSTYDMTIVPPARVEQIARYLTEFQKM